MTDRSRFEAAIDWLREDVRDDLDAAAEYDARDWVRAAVDTVLAPGLLVRTTVHSCVYAINHAEPDAETTFSVAEPAVRADCWRSRDAVQASAVSVLLLGAFSTPLVSLPARPALAGVVVLQCVPLAADPALTAREVAA